MGTEVIEVKITFAGDLAVFGPNETTFFVRSFEVVPEDRIILTFLDWTQNIFPLDSIERITTSTDDLVVDKEDSRRYAILMDGFHKVSNPNRPDEYVLRATELLSIRLTESAKTKTERGKAWDFRLNGKFYGTIGSEIEDAKMTSLEIAFRTIEHLTKLFK